MTDADTDWAEALSNAAIDGSVSDAFGLPVLDVPAQNWVAVLTAAREVGLTYFDWLSAVDALDDGFFIVAHVADLSGTPPLHLLVRTLIPREEPRLASATAVYRGASWHERETFEMFGVIFDDHPNLTPLLLPEGFDGHPLRKDFVLAARVAKAWPGAKEPGEGHEAAAGRRGSPSRRRMLPPGVPEDWPKTAPATPTPPAVPVSPAPPAVSDSPAPPAVPGGTGPSDA